MLSKLKRFLLIDNKEFLKYCVYSRDKKFELEIKQECLRHGFSNPNGYIWGKADEVILQGNYNNQFDVFVYCVACVVKKHSDYDSSGLFSIRISYCSGFQNNKVFLHNLVNIYNDGYYEEFIDGRFETYPIKGMEQKLYKPRFTTNEEDTAAFSNGASSSRVENQ